MPSEGGRFAQGKLEDFEMDKCSKCGFAFGVGFICLCGGGAIVSGEAYELSRASDMVCLYRHYELAPPLGCDEEPGPHNRSGWFTNVASTSSSVTISSGTFTIIDTPTVAYVARDAEDAAESSSPTFAAVMLGPYSGMPPGAGSITFNLVRPTKDERLALIRQSAIGPST